jgi:hypothetical protein
MDIKQHARDTAREAVEQDLAVLLEADRAEFLELYDYMSFGEWFDSWLGSICPFAADIEYCSDAIGRELTVDEINEWEKAWRSELRRLLEKKEWNVEEWDARDWFYSNNSDEDIIDHYGFSSATTPDDVAKIVVQLKKEVFESDGYVLIGAFDFLMGIVEGL